MNNQKVARELVRIAKDLVAVRVREGEIYKLDLRRALAGTEMPQTKNLIKRLYKNGDGEVKVESVDGDKAFVFEPHLPVAFAGSVVVPVDSLK